MPCEVTIRGTDAERLPLLAVSANPRLHHWGHLYNLSHCPICLWFGGHHATFLMEGGTGGHQTMTEKQKRLFTLLATAVLRTYGDQQVEQEP
jgi:hypothetical protein